MLSLAFFRFEKYYESQIAGTIGKKNAYEMNFWTLDEYSKFRATLYNPREICVFDILYWGGLRKGELLALTPADVINGGLSINKTVSFKKSIPIFSEPKTPKSKRTVTLPDFCMIELNEYINMLYGIQPEDRIFDYNSNQAINNVLNRHIEQAGVKKIRVHDLRHSHASLCVEMGMDILLISERLGHENIETTLKTYSHLYPNKQLMLASELNDKALETFKNIKN